MSLIQKSHKSMYAKQYYEANKETILLKKKEYYINNKTEIDEKHLDYYYENREQMLISAHNYRKLNIDKIKVNDRIRGRKSYYKNKYNLNHLDNDRINELIEIKDNQNIKNDSFEYVVTLKELYDLQI